MTGRGTRPGKGSPWERGRPARILLLMVVAELPRGFAGSHPLATETAMTKPKETHLGARASRPHPFSFIEAAERQREFAGIHPVDGNGNDQAEGEPRRGCRSIQVGETAEAAPGFVRAGRPRSQEAIIVRAGRPRSQGDPFWALRAVEAAPYRFVALRGSSLFLAASFDFFSIQVI